MKILLSALVAAAFGVAISAAFADGLPPVEPPPLPKAECTGFRIPVAYPTTVIFIFGEWIPVEWESGWVEICAGTCPAATPDCRPNPFAQNFTCNCI